MLLVALYSPNGTYDATFLANYAYINLVDQITRVKGISNINVFGAGQYAMRFWVNPDQLAKLNITASEVIAAVNSQNTVNPAGQIGGPPSLPGQEYTYTAIAQGRLVTEKQFGEIVVRENADGSVVRLKDVARIELGAQIYSLAGRLNGKPSAVMAIYQLPGSNALDAARDVKTLMEELKKQFSAGPGLRRFARHHAGGEPRAGGNSDDPVGGAAAGHYCRVYFSARLARLAHSVAGRAGFAHRHFHPLSDVWLFHQYLVPLRPGPGHRTGGG